jgi:hypothetical protein
MQLSCDLPLLCVFLLLLAYAHAETHYWEYYHKLPCVVQKHCKTAVFKGSLKKAEEHQADWGEFQVEKLNTNSKLLEAKETWVTVLVKREPPVEKKAKLFVRAPSSSSPLRLCCKPFDPQVVFVVCKATTYFAALSKGSTIRVVSGSLLALKEQLFSQLPKLGLHEFEQQSKDCKASGAVWRIVSDSMQPPQVKDGQLANIIAGSPREDSVEDEAFSVTLARHDATDKDEEPYELCCSARRDQKRVEVRCLRDTWLDPIKEGDNIVVWKADWRRPLKQRLRQQRRCLPPPTPTPQRWYAGADPTPIETQDAQVSVEMAKKAIKAAREKLN